MEQQSRRERKKEETRRRILEASFKLFVEQGFENTTIDQIAEEADIGKGTFYNYFPTKEAVLFEFMEDIGRRRGEKIWADIISLRETRQRLSKAFATLSSWFEEYPELARAYTMDRINTLIKTPASYKINHLELFLAEIIRLGQEIGDIRDDITPSKLVGYLMGITLIQFCHWFERGAGPGLHKLCMQGVDFFLIGALSTEDSYNTVSQEVK